MADALPPSNPDPETDPCQTQPGTGLDFALMVTAATAATDAAEDAFLDCVIHDRNFRMRQLMPPRVIAEDEGRADGWLTKVLDALDPFVKEAIERIDCFPSIIDPLSCPSHMLDHLLYHLGNPFLIVQGFADIEKRRLALALFAIYGLKGTDVGIIGAIRLIFGINVTDIVAANIQGWMLDFSDLDIDTILQGGSAYERRSFEVMVDTTLSDRQRAQMTEVIKYMKAANTHFIGFIEPQAAAHVSHWELDLSELDHNAYCH